MVRWTAAQYVRRVVVDVAGHTGQSVREVLREPFALTLWTWFELLRIRKERTAERLGERVDVAGMMALAFHDPKQLRGEHQRYVAAVQGLEAPKPEDERKRYQGMLEDLKRLRPME